MGYQLQACKSTRHMLRSLCRQYHAPMVPWWSRTLQLASGQHCLLDTAVALRSVSGCYFCGCNMLFTADNLQDCKYLFPGCSWNFFCSVLTAQMHIHAAWHMHGGAHTSAALQL